MECKFCPDCRSDKPATDFTKDVRRRDGLSFYCRDCRKIRDEASRRKRNGPRRNRVRPRELVVSSDHKWCPDCDSVKPLSEFPTSRGSRSGYMTYCRPCHNARTRASADRHGGARNYHLRRRYGITAEHFDRMFAEQGGLCAICREAPAEHVDHDHATNRVRALLCFNCNGALGQFRDRADLMLKAAAYVNRDPDVSIAALVSGVASIFIGDFTDPRPEDEPRIA